MWASLLLACGVPVAYHSFGSISSLLGVGEMDEPGAFMHPSWFYLFFYSDSARAGKSRQIALCSPQNPLWVTPARHFLPKAVIHHDAPESF